MVFITVKEGALTYYLYDDPTCTPHVVTKGEGSSTTGAAMVRNESAAPAQDVNVIIRADGRRLRGRARRTEPELRLLRNEPDDRRGLVYAAPRISQRACMALFKSPLTDSNPRPLLTMEVCPFCGPRLVAELGNPRIKSGRVRAVCLRRSLIRAAAGGAGIRAERWAAVPASVVLQLVSVDRLLLTARPNRLNQLSGRGRSRMSASSARATSSSLSLVGQIPTCRRGTGGWSCLLTACC